MMRARVARSDGKETSRWNSSMVELSPAPRTTSLHAFLRQHWLLFNVRCSHHRSILVERVQGNGRLCLVITCFWPMLHAYLQQF